MKYYPKQQKINTPANVVRVGDDYYSDDNKNLMVLFLFLGLFDRSIQLFEFIFKYF